MAWGLRMRIQSWSKSQQYDEHPIGRSSPFSSQPKSKPPFAVDYTSKKSTSWIVLKVSNQTLNSSQNEGLWFL